MATFEQNAVSKVVWRWTETAAPKPAGMPRQAKAFIQFLVMAAIGALFYFFPRAHPHRVMAYIVFSLAGIVLFSGLFIPPLFKLIERFGAWLGRIVGTGLTYLLLVPFFYLAFAPAHFFLNLRGKDPMCRAVPTSATTYWVPRPPISGPEHFRKQH